MRNPRAICSRLPAFLSLPFPTILQYSAPLPNSIWYRASAQFIPYIQIFERRRPKKSRVLNSFLVTTYRIWSSNDALCTQHGQQETSECLNTWSWASMYEFILKKMAYCEAPQCRAVMSGSDYAPNIPYRSLQTESKGTSLWCRGSKDHIETGIAISHPPKKKLDEKE